MEDPGQRQADRQTVMRHRAEKFSLTEQRDQNDGRQDEGIELDERRKASPRRPHRLPTAIGSGTFNLSKRTIAREHKADHGIRRTVQMTSEPRMPIERPASELFRSWAGSKNASILFFSFSCLNSHIAKKHHGRPAPRPDHHNPGTCLGRDETSPCGFARSDPGSPC